MGEFAYKKKREEGEERKKREEKDRHYLAALKNACPFPFRALGTIKLAAIGPGTADELSRY